MILMLFLLANHGLFAAQRTKKGETCRAPTALYRLESASITSLEGPTLGVATLPAMLWRLLSAMLVALLFLFLFLSLSLSPSLSLFLSLFLFLFPLFSRSLPLPLPILLPARTGVGLVAQSTYSTVCIGQTLSSQRSPKTHKAQRRSHTSTSTSTESNAKERQEEEHNTRTQRSGEEGGDGALGRRAEGG